MTAASILLALAVLACPAMMYFMMRGRRQRDGRHDPTPEGGTKDQEIRALRERVQQLESHDRGVSPR